MSCFLRSIIDRPSPWIWEERDEFWGVFVIPTWIGVVRVIATVLSPFIALGGVALGVYLTRKSDRKPEPGLTRIADARPQAHLGSPAPA